MSVHPLNLPSFNFAGQTMESAITSGVVEYGFINFDSDSGSLLSNGRLPRKAGSKARPVCSSRSRKAFSDMAGGREGTGSTDEAVQKHG